MCLVVTQVIQNYTGSFYSLMALITLGQNPNAFLVSFVCEGSNLKVFCLFRYFL
jgi:hypothetical protein